MSTPRTDAALKAAQKSGVGPIKMLVAMVNHARRLERELAVVREKLADHHESFAKVAAFFGHVKETTDYRAAAAHLRDLTSPVDPERLP